MPPTLDRVLTGAYPAAQRAAAADPGSPEGEQARYDAARALQITLPQAANASCRPLLTALRSYAGAQVRAAESYDRQRPGAVKTAHVAASRASAAVQRTRDGCRGRDVSPIDPSRPLEPGDGELFDGLLRVTAPVGAARMRVVVDGRVRDDVAVTGGKAAAYRLDGGPERIGWLELRFRTATGATVGTAAVADLIRVPGAALSAPAPQRRDASLDARLAAAAAGFDGYTGLWIADLARGRTGSFNALARFPAASTVKLGVIAAALTRYRSSTARDAVRYDLEQIGGWSSNLAANRLYRLLGRARVERALQALGARDSTYPGEYRVGTSRGATPRQPPLVSQRVTTASDLAAIFTTLHRAATGDHTAMRQSGLRPADARLALGILARAQPVGDNAGLFQPYVPRRWISASKHGWLNAARHSAQLIFAPSGPVLAVAVAYRDPLSLAQARRVGRRVAALAVTLASR